MAEVNLMTDFESDSEINFTDVKKRKKKEKVTKLPEEEEKLSKVVATEEEPKKKKKKKDKEIEHVETCLDEKSKKLKKGEMSHFQKCFSELTETLLIAVGKNEITPSLVKAVLGHFDDLGQVTLSLVEENARLKGRNDVLESLPAKTKNELRSSKDGEAGKPVVASYSVVVKSTENKPTKEVAQVLKKEVFPTLGARIQEIRPGKNVTVIRTPTEEDRRKIVTGAAIQKAGLTAETPKEKQNKVMIRGVASEMTPASFMDELYAKNYRRKMKEEDFKKEVKLVTKPWEAEIDGKNRTVVVQGSATVMEAIIGWKQCGIEWRMLTGKLLSSIETCYRCIGVGHTIKQCKFTKNVCKNCGEEGHEARICSKQAHCRNCHQKGRSATHQMMTVACPLFNEMTERRNARH